MTHFLYFVPAYTIVFTWRIGRGPLLLIRPFLFTTHFLFHTMLPDVKTDIHYL